MIGSSRAELHLHTKLSDGISVISVEEIIEKAEELGISAVAFTNLDNVQDFPKIAKYANTTDLKIIYGAELRYMNKDGKAPYGITLLVKNQAGIKELYKIISSIEFDGVCNLIDLDVLNQNRKNLLVGSCGNMGELYEMVEKGEDAEKITTFYDYFEIYPTDDQTEKGVYKKIYELGEKSGVPVVATGNCHYIDQEDKICCDIIMTALNQEAEKSDKYYVHTTDEMLEEFCYLGNYGAQRTVLENSQFLANIIEKAEPIKTKKHYVVFENAYSDLESLCYNNAFEFYGNPLPQGVKDRLCAELELLKDEQFATRYLLAKKIVDFAKEYGQLTSVRGAVGSTLVAFLLGISEVNPLPPHYYCPHCHYFEQSNLADDGFDLPQKICPVCKSKLKADGHNIPYEVFMGIKGEKTPEIDLSVPEDFRLKAQSLMDNLFGAEKVAQAGVIGISWERAAESFIQKYESIKGITLEDKEKKKLISKIAGTKRGVGMHPGGVMIVPHDMDFEDFTPLNQNWAPRPTTHLEIRSLHNAISKQYILGYSFLDLLLELEKQTGKSIKDVDFNDPKIYDLFSKGDTDDIPDFDSDFARNLLSRFTPRNFNELVKISCLCHGTHVWKYNAENLIEDGVCTYSDVIAARDDIMMYLIGKGMDKDIAFEIMETVRKGLWASGKLSVADKKYFTDEMMKNDVPQWYIESLSKIYYIFPKAHGVACVMNAVRCAWFKIYYPNEFLSFQLDSECVKI